MVGTIEINTTKRIKTLDIIGGTVEQIGKYRIVWNKWWQGQKQDTPIDASLTLATGT